MSDIVQQFASPMVTQEGMQANLSVFADGGEIKNPFVLAMMEKYKHKNQKSSKYKTGGEISDETPSIYVADLLAYNEGRLQGFWLDLSEYDSGAEVMERIKQFLDAQSKKTGELHEEYAIHDFENFPREMYSEYMTEEDFDKIISAYKAQKELDLPYEIILQIQREYGIDDFERIRDGFLVKTTTDNEDKQLGIAYVEIVGFDNIKNKDYYFDFAEYGSDLRSDMTDEEQEEHSYDELSDNDLGELFIELNGGIENASQKMLQDYFDYERFGSDLSIDDFESYRFGNEIYWFRRNLKNGGKIKGGKLRDNDRKEYLKAKKRVDAMSDEDVFEQIEDIYYYEMQDEDVSPEDLRNDIGMAREKLIEFYAEEDEDQDDNFFDGGGITKKQGYETYHNTLSETLDELKDYARRNGYTLGEFSREVGHISYGTTWRAYAPCMDASGKEVNTIQVQIYRMDSGKYELNAYFDKKRKKKDDSEYLYDGEPLPFGDGGETHKSTITLIFDGKKHTYNATFIDGEFDDVYIPKSANDNPLWDYIENDWSDWFDHESERNNELEEMYYGEEAIYSKTGAIRQAIDDVADQIANELSRNPNKTTFNLDTGEVEIGANYYADGGLFADGGKTDEKYTVYLYFGGQMPDKVYKNKSLEEARSLIMSAEHSEVIDSRGNSVDLSTFDLGGIVHSYNGAPLGIVGSTINFNRAGLIEGDMFSGDAMFADGGEITDAERKNSRKNTPKLF